LAIISEDFDMARVSDSNIPLVPLRWSVARASAEFDIAQATLERKLRDAQVFPDNGGAYSTKAIKAAVFGSLHNERLRRIKEEADKVAMANQVARGELLERRSLEQGFAEIAAAIVGIIGKSGLSREDQVQIQKNLSSIPVIIKDVVRRQDKRPQAEKC
jgi:hypothetical protein